MTNKKLLNALPIATTTDFPRKTFGIEIKKFDWLYFYPMSANLFTNYIFKIVNIKKKCFQESLIKKLFFVKLVIQHFIFIEKY